MECILIFLFLVTTLGLLAGFGLGRAPRTGLLVESYRLLAQRYHGTLYRTGWRGMPRVVFHYRSACVMVEALARAPQDLGPGPAVRMHLPWPESELSAEVRHPPRPPHAALHDGLQPIPLASDDFGRRCSVRGSDPRSVAEFFSAVLRWHVERLRAQPAVSPLCLQIGRGAMTITKALAVHNGSELMQIVEAGLDLYDQAMLTRTRDITFLEQQSAQVLEQAVCRICGEEIHEGLVFCRRCKTPHHRECWQYVGRCSVFACGETLFREPQVAERVPGDTGERRSSD
jgi:hypothetical protein